MENITQGQFWSSTASGDLGDEITQSARFDGGNKLEADIQNDFGNFSADCTLSFWIKFTNTAGGSIWFAPNIGGNGYDRSVTINSSNQIQVKYTGNQSPSHSTEVFRDPSAWYHIMVISESDNVKLYVNGDLITHHTSGGWSSGTSAYSGDKMTFSSADEDGNERTYYLAEVNFLDGTKATVGTDLGRTNEDGVWVPVEPDFTAAEYGTNGFRLQFNDSSNLGDDSAPIGSSGHTTARDFTASGFETTAISSSNFDNDIDYNDTPTSNYATFNPLNKKVSAGTKHISNSNLRISAGSTNAYIDAQSTQAASEFDCYCEALVTAQDLNGIGVGDRDAAIASGAGSYVTYRENGAIVRYPGNNNIGTEDTYDTGDVLGMTVTSTQVTFYKNGTLQGTYDHNLTGDFFVLGMAYNTGATSTMDFNFGQQDFRYAVPTGFKALQTNNMSEPTIKNGKDHFGVLTWTGDGTNGRDISGLNFQPDLVWIKRRNGSNQHNLYDSVRGVTKHLTPDNNYNQSTTANSLTAFNSDGIEVGTGASDNTSSSTYVGWCWKAGGTAVTNNDGDTQSTISANPDAGFSIVTWTGTGSNTTVGHGLNSAPELVFIKNYGTNTTDWVVLSDEIEADEYLHLNAANSVPANPTPSYTNGRHTASVLNIGSFSHVNESSGSQIAYCWHSVEGYSKFGTYTGNASNDGPFIYLGFKPALVVIKAKTQIENWMVYDNGRHPNNPCEKVMRWNITNEESGTGNDIDFLSNGFKIRNTVNDVNRADPLIYMAWAEHPFGGGNAAPVIAR